MTDSELLSAAITATGLSVRGFAAQILTRDPRTVWRWLAGDNPLPQAVRAKCEALVRASAVDSSGVGDGVGEPE